MNTGSHRKAWVGSKGQTAFLFLLAVLMLVVSCPFKRLLQAESNIQSSAKQSLKWNDTERRSAAYKSSDCCAQKQKITLVKVEVNKQTLPASDFPADQNGQSGFSIHYFLSGTEKHYSSYAFSSASSLPLFLQHRRLLI